MRIPGCTREKRKRLAAFVALLVCLDLAADRALAAELECKLEIVAPARPAGGIVMLTVTPMARTFEGRGSVTYELSVLSGGNGNRSATMQSGRGDLVAGDWIELSRSLVGMAPGGRMSGTLTIRDPDDGAVICSEEAEYAS